MKNMSDVVGADDIFALLNGAPVSVGPELGNNTCIENSWQALSTKDDIVQSVPVVILDDGQIAVQTNNGQIYLLANSVDELVVPDFISATADLSNALQEATIDNAEHILTDEVDVVNEESNGNKALLASDKSDIHSEWIELEKLKSFNPGLAAFKCLTCQYVTQNQQDINSHQHKHIFSESKQAKENPEAVELISNDKDVQEQFVFLCAQCSDIFGSIEQCKEHMIKDHNMMLSDELLPETTLEETSLPLKPIDTNSGNDDAMSSNRDQKGDDGSDKLVMAIEPAIDRKSAESAEQKSKSSGRKKMKSLKADPDYDVRPFKCKHNSCVHRFRSNETLEQHAACHQAPNRREYTCSQCNDNFEEWRNCSIHLWNVHSIDIDLYTCGICGLHKSASRMNLETHMKIHRDIREFGCPECGKRFKQKAQLRNHRVTHIKKKDLFVCPDAQTPRWYMTKKCDICFKTYADSKCLKKHVQAVHSKLKPYVCQVCGHSSARKAMLQSHLRQHTGEKPYACATCNFKTGDHNSLRRHVMRHSGERPYKCPHCPYASIQSTSFKNHLQIRHPGKEGAFACVRCPFTTVSQPSFILHLSDHKNNLIATDQSDVEVFPENVAAAQLIYQCLGAYPGDGSRFQADVTASSTSDDGTKQTITIEIPTNEVPTTDDEDTANCFLQSDDIDTGGITIPAEPHPLLVDFT